MAKLVDPQKLIVLQTASKIYGMNPEYLRQLIEKKKLEGWQIDGYFWTTTRDAVEKYMKNRRRPGRPSKS